MNKFGFIGCGNMGGALLRAVSKSVTAEQIMIFDPNTEKTALLASELGVCSVELKTLVAECDYIFLGVKPQIFELLFADLRPMLQDRKNAPVLVSMAAGVSVAAVEKMADCACGVIRIMPNTPASVGEGMILYTHNARVSDGQIQDFLAAMSAAGTLDWIPEDKIDAASALSGCGPAFVYLFAEALADGAVECGLPRDKAMLYAAQTLKGAAELLLQSGKHPGELKDAVCSPGGTTIAGVHALEVGGVRATAMDAVTAAYERTLELKK
ncbi:MAG: pyrroline-5-carboxylate reductase [Clostridia bacterium]|nr:pyrroline-5-carboxylate reductase [Clostridia bacterium]